MRIKLDFIVFFSLINMLLACNPQHENSSVGSWEPEVKQRMLAHCVDQASIGLDHRDSSKVAQIRQICACSVDIMEQQYLPQQADTLASSTMMQIIQQAQKKCP